MSKLQIVAGSFAVLMGLVLAPGCAPESPEYEGDDETAQQDDAVKGGRPAKPKKKCQDPDRTYVANSPEECAVVRFFCEEGEPFFDDCGCGCTTAVTTPCGASTCASGEFCCNESCGICAPEGGVCTQQFCGDG
jgi:hypothetical protein